MHRTLVWATCALLLPLAAQANPPTKKIEALVKAGDLDGLVLATGDFVPEDAPARDRVRLANAFAAAAQKATDGGDRSKALFFGQRVVELDPTGPRYTALAGWAKTLDDAGVEAEALEGLLKKSPRNVPALTRLAQLREASGNFAAALALWDRVPAGNAAEAQSNAGVARCRKSMEQAKAAKKAEEEKKARRETIAAVVPSPDAGSGEAKVAAAVPVKEKPAQAAPPSANAKTAGNDHFKITFSEKGGHFPDADYAAKVLAVLEKVWSYLCPKLGHCPSSPVPVILYTSQEYAAGHGGGPQAKRNGYASSTGIRVSFAQEMTTGVEEVLAHEFVHYVIDRHAPKTPRWVHESFATFFASRYAGTGGGGSFTPGSTCQAIPAAQAPSFAQFVDPGAAWAGGYRESRPLYDFGCAFARYLEEKYQFQFPALLDELRTEPPSDAFKATYGVDLIEIDKAVRAKLL